MQVQQKDILRQKMKFLRQQKVAKEAKASSNEADTELKPFLSLEEASALFSSLKQKKGNFLEAGVLLYVPLLGEFPVLSLLPFFKENGIPLFLPRIKEKNNPDTEDTQATQEEAGEKESELEIVPWQGEMNTLQKHDRFGFLQPKPNQKALRESGCSIPRLWVIPGLAFDKHGGRLGFGGGYYDRLWSAYQQKQQSQESAICVVGACFSWQLVDRCPMEPHDKKVDGLLMQEDTTKKVCLSLLEDF